MSASRVLAFLVGAAGCGSAAPHRAPELTNQPAAPPADAAPACPTSRPDVDADLSVGISFAAPATAELRCDGAARRNCRAPIAVTVTNCRPGPIVAEKLGWDFAAPTIELVDGTFPHTLAPGASWSFAVVARGEGQVVIPVDVRSTIYRWTLQEAGSGASHVDRSRPEEGLATLGPPPVHVTNPARDEAVRACQACRGLWGHHGMMWTIDPSPGADNGDSCVCRSTDGGAACRDSDDCQGWCEATGFVIVGHEGGTGVAIGYSTGVCSAFTSQESCAHPIPSGARKRPAAPRQVTEICID